LAKKYGTKEQKKIIMDEIAENEAMKLKNEKDAEKKETEKKIKTKGKMTS
jgi:hypothetical protein